MGNDGAPRTSSVPWAMLRLLALVSFARAQTGTTPAPVPFSSLEPTPEGTMYPSITPYPTFNPTVTVKPTLTRAPTFQPTVTSFPSSFTDSPTLSLYPTQTSDKNGNGTCALCDPGQTMETPGRKIPPYSADFTCADLDERLAAAGGSAGSAACEAILDKVNPTFAFLEMQAYCGCDGVRPPDLCTFCEAGYVVPDSNKLNVVEVPGIGNVTCEQADAFTKYIRDEKNCMEWSLALTDPCCAKGSAPPSRAPAQAPSAPTAPTPPTSTSAGDVARSCAGLVAAAWGTAISIVLLS